MNYLIYHTYGSILEVSETGIETSTSLTFVGANYNNYEDDYWSNLIHLLEHFSSEFAPRNPIKGQLWYDSKHKNLKVFSNIWNNLMVTPVDTSTFCQLSDTVDELQVTDIKTGLSIANKKYVDDPPFILESGKDYIKYANNYMIYFTNVNNNDSIKLPFSMSNMNYSIIANCCSVSNNVGKHVSVLNKTLSSFTVSAADQIESVSVVVMGFTK
jgi:hypothetical protein